MTINAAKVGDIGTGHDGFPSTAIALGSPNVFIDGMPAARVTDPLEEHSKPGSSSHPRHIISGSGTVFVNGSALAITGSKVDCGGEIIGSGTVFVGDMVPACSDLVSVTELFDEHFCLVDQWNGQPFGSIAYGMTTSKGQKENIVDKSGKTEFVRRLSEDNISLDYIFQIKAGIR